MKPKYYLSCWSVVVLATFLFSSIPFSHGSAPVWMVFGFLLSDISSEAFGYLNVLVLGTLMSVVLSGIALRNVGTTTEMICLASAWLVLAGTMLSYSFGFSPDNLDFLLRMMAMNWYFVVALLGGLILLGTRR